MLQKRTASAADLAPATHKRVAPAAAPVRSYADATTTEEMHTWVRTSSRALQFANELIERCRNIYDEPPTRSRTLELHVRLRNVIVTGNLHRLDAYPQPPPTLSARVLGPQIAAQATKGEHFASTRLRHNGLVDDVDGTPVSLQGDMSVALMVFSNDRACRINAPGGSDPRRVPCAISHCASTLSREIGYPLIPVECQMHMAVVGVALPFTIVPDAFAASNTYTTLRDERIARNKGTGAPGKRDEKREFPGLPIYLARPPDPVTTVGLLFDKFLIFTGPTSPHEACSVAYAMCHVLEYFTVEAVAAREAKSRARMDTLDEMTATIHEFATDIMAVSSAPRAAQTTPRAPRPSTRMMRAVIRGTM